MSSQVAAITHFEIYVLAKNRWTLQVRFRNDQKDEALDEAKTIERTLNLPVKVMRETYFPQTNTCEEAAVYISPRIAPPEAAPGRGIEAAARGKGGRGAAQQAQPTFDGESTGTLILMIMVIVVVALAIAATGTEAVTSVLDEMERSGRPVAGSTRSSLLFGSFALVFLGVAIPMTVWFVAGAEKRAKERAKRAAKAQKGRPAARAPMLSREERALGRAARSMVWDMLTAPFRRPEPVAAEEPAPPPAPPAPPEPATESPPQPEPPPAAPAPEAQEPVPPQPEPAPQPETEKQPKGEAVDVSEKHRMTAMRFLGEVVSHLKKASPQLDTFSRFGVNLVLAGAVEKMAGREQLDDAARRLLLRESIEMLGTKAPLAESFCQKMDEYVLEPRYLQMVQAGGEFMEAFLAGEGDPLKRLGSVLEAWNKPQAKQQTQRIVTVLFTDIVGSTDMTQAQGDMAAQSLVRRHNTIVRNALSEFDGREIKHTGDGIMASFASTSNAVDAAIAVQRAVGDYTATSTANGMILRLRIGINAGEPIEEEDDLFGTTVQLAARLCAKAEPEQILCSNVVRELSAGKGRRFAHQGEHSLKGFRDPVPLYEIVWQDAPELDTASGGALAPGFGG